MAGDDISEHLLGSLALGLRDHMASTFEKDESNLLPKLDETNVVLIIVNKPGLAELNIMYYLLLWDRPSF